MTVLWTTGRKRRAHPAPAPAPAALRQAWNKFMGRVGEGEEEIISAALTHAALQHALGASPRAIVVKYESHGSIVWRNIWNQSVYCLASYLKPIGLLFGVISKSRGSIVWCKIWVTWFYCLMQYLSHVVPLFDAGSEINRAIVRGPIVFISETNRPIVLGHAPHCSKVFCVHIWNQQAHCSRVFCHAAPLL